MEIQKFLLNFSKKCLITTSFWVYNYLEWLEKAFVIYRCQRYDLQGKSVLKTQEKFYLADASLKYCIMGFNPKSIAAMLENIVYFELRRRGYDVYVGKHETKEAILLQCDVTSVFMFRCAVSCRKTQTERLPIYLRSRIIIRNML